MIFDKSSSQIKAYLRLKIQEENADEVLVRPRVGFLAHFRWFLDACTKQWNRQTDRQTDRRSAIHNEFCLREGRRTTICTHTRFMAAVWQGRAPRAAANRTLKHSHIPSNNIPFCPLETVGDRFTGHLVQCLWTLGAVRLRRLLLSYLKRNVHLSYFKA